MALLIRLPSADVDLVEMGMTSSDEGSEHHIATLSVLDGQPVSEYKYRQLKTINVRGEFWPVEDVSLNQWTTLIRHLDTEEDPVVSLFDVEEERESSLGLYYITRNVLENADIVNGVPGRQRWRIQLQEFPEGEPVSPEGDTIDPSDTGLPTDIVPIGTVI